MRLLPTATSQDERGRDAHVAVLPVGSFEQHGPHLPLATDTVVACAVADAVARRHDLLLLPPVTISCSHEHGGWAGTVSISARTLHAVVADIADSLRHSGIGQLVLVNGHGGNYVLANLVQEANVVERRMALFPTRDDWERARRAGRLSSSHHDDMHAGEIETSILLHTCPELVRESYQDADHTSDRPHLLVLGMSAYTTTGVIGQPSLATAEKGRAVLESLTSTFADTLDALVSGTSA